ncbi:hypothetical protein N7522_001792 [Penicillium canescens]|nr:hypothetical protein N7522_001792 [Penicillium canescens]
MAAGIHQKYDIKAADIMNPLKPGPCPQQGEHRRVHCNCDILVSSTPDVRYGPARWAFDARRHICEDMLELSLCLIVVPSAGEDIISA